MEMLPASVSTQSAGQQPETWAWGGLQWSPPFCRNSRNSRRGRLVGIGGLALDLRLATLGEGRCQLDRRL
jgi:hypothetical protein